MLEENGAGEIVEVTDLDDVGLLDLARAVERRERAAARAKLRLAYQWCVSHPATEETGAASWGTPTLPGLPDERLGGEGTPAVAAFTPEPMALALGVSTESAMALLADTLDLVHRLPAVWAQVEDLAVPAWKARRIAQATHSLSLAAAAYVDEQVATRADRAGWPTVQSVIDQAVARFHPQQVAVRERRGRHGWHVTLDHRPALDGFTGTSTLTASGDTLAFTRLHDHVCDHAALLGRLGDPDPLGARKAKALAALADQQTTIELPIEPGETTRIELAPAPPTRTHLYLHLGLTDATELTSGALGRAERLGPATATTIREWVGHSQVTITPVLDLARTDSVDRHDPPGWMRELVVLRDPTCVFPHCARPARSCDLDHIEAYDTGPPETGPPLGQTRPGNLAPLCRRHHRAKTFGGWSYTMPEPGTYLWNTPYGDHFLRDHTGTRDATPDRPRFDSDRSADADPPDQ